MVRNLPACGPIPLYIVDCPTIHYGRAACSRPKSFLRVFTEPGPLAALAVAVALLVGIAGPASAQFFNFGNFGGPPQRPHAARRRRLVRRRYSSRRFNSSTPKASGAQADTGGFFQGAAAGEARDRAGAQRTGARRCDGRLACLWSRGCLCRAARHGRDPQAQDRLRPHQISAQGRSGRLGRRGQGHSRHRETRRHRRDARAQ